MRVFYNIIITILFNFTCQLFAIPAKDMESYRKQLPHVNEATRQFITESALMNYDGLMIKDENGKSIKTRHLGMVGSSIEIKNADELYFIISYFRDKDYTVRTLALLSVIALIEKNNLKINLEWSYGTFVDTKDKSFLDFIKTVIGLIPKITIFDDK